MIQLSQYVSLKGIYFFLGIGFFSVFLSIRAFAQDKGQNEYPLKPKKSYFLRTKYQSGYILPNKGLLKGENIHQEPYEFFQSANLEFGKQTQGQRLWERLYNYPSYGVGVYALDLFKGREELGTPYAVYGFFTAPFTRSRRASFDFEIGFGMSFNWNPYHEESNPFNNSVGSSANVYVDLGAHYHLRLSRHWYSQIGLAFTHFSNGALRLPNAGINLVSPRVALRYEFQPPTTSFAKGDIPEYEAENEFYVMLGMGWHNVRHDLINYFLAQETGLENVNETYFLSTLSMIYQRQVSWKVKLGGGMDITYDGAVPADVDLDDGVWDAEPRLKTLDKMNVALVGSFELLIDRLSIVLQPGYEVLRRNYKGRPERLYQRAGVKYHILPHVFTGINIRSTRFTLARFIEWNVGYRIRWK